MTPLKTAWLAPPKRKKERKKQTKKHKNLNYNLHKNLKSRKFMIWWTFDMSRSRYRKQMSSSISSSEVCPYVIQRSLLSNPQSLRKRRDDPQRMNQEGGPHTSLTPAWLRVILATLTWPAAARWATRWAAWRAFGGSLSVSALEAALRCAGRRWRHPTLWL